MTISTSASTTSRTRKSTRKPTPEFSAVVELIGPEKAQEYLDLMPHNRRKRIRVKDRYIKAMLHNQWKLTGESIKFNTRGELIDGQHRLEAIIESGKTIQILVCRNVPPEAFMELDTGATRTPGDLLTVAGYDYTNGVASTIRYITSIYKIESGQVNYTSFAHDKIDPETLLEYAESYSEALIEAVKKTMTKQARVVCGPPAMFAALYYVFAEHNKKGAEQFFDMLIDGLGYELGKTDPVYQLRRLLESFKTNKYLRRPNFYKAAIVIKAWNAFQNRDSISSLRFSENESWPEINRRRTRVAESANKPEPDTAKKASKSTRANSSVKKASKKKNSRRS